MTTYLIGQDGLSFAPASAGTIDFVSRYFAAVNGACPPELQGGCSVADLLGIFHGRTALNLAYLAPHGTIRAEVMGLENRPPSAEELAAMRPAVEQALDEGAIGLSTGLDYIPGRFADAAELTALCEPVARAGGVYVTHMRGYEADGWRGMAEVCAIAERSGVAAHVSHYHGPANMLASLVDDGRARGLDITFDTYPYLRGSTILAMVALRADVQAGGVERSLERLTTLQLRTRLLEEWFAAIGDVLPRIVLSYVAAPQYRWAEETPLPETARRAGVPVGEFGCDLLVASELAVGCVFAQLPTNTEADVRALLRHPAHLASSDGILLGSRPHPRAWGAFARFLGRHTRELGDWHWGEAAVHLAGHAARRFGLADPGLLRRGLAADVVALDPGAITDRATYDEPRRPADGVAHVLVNGVLALPAGELTGATPGRALRRGTRLTERPCPSGRPPRGSRRTGYDGPRGAGFASNQRGHEGDRGHQEVVAGDQPGLSPGRRRQRRGNERRQTAGEDRRELIADRDAAVLNPRCQLPRREIQGFDAGLSVAGSCCPPVVLDRRDCTTGVGLVSGAPEYVPADGRGRA